ncbi:hypothetical protein STA3757_37550 [Stanieria sp. NIES-3757]|nr:hypothetical protein STA3757_37550 [Stanieria sp. NIES-3757]
MSYTDKENKAGTHPPSDGSELIPAEVQATTRESASKSLNAPLGAGYTVDDEGIVNNYAMEPKMSESEYPSPKQQQRYIFLGAAAILFVALAVWIALAVS